MLFRKIGLAIAFSPRAEALLAETIRMKMQWGTELVIIHVGEHGETEEQLLGKLLGKHSLAMDKVTVCWRKGKPSEEILKACKEENIDLLVAGALQQEGLVQHYVGSIARRILRKANCSVLTLVRPGISPKSLEQIVVSADDYEDVEKTLSLACALAQREKSKWLHVVREVKLYGLTMSSADQATEEEYNRLKTKLIETEVDNVQQLLNRVDHDDLKINIKVLAGKSGFEIAQFAKRKQADLLVVPAPPKRLRLLDRIFPHDLEYVFADLPCNVLVVSPQAGKEAAHG
ncbi:MAG: universal stress protein [Cyclobacteriaceae bacterium]|nr:universal stress protein [Cyclobacteriaceae bacterium]UYN86664.1 MAG: universal stress protein [Cyclobacteriaceae bacterium]